MDFPGLENLEKNSRTFKNPQEPCQYHQVLPTVGSEAADTSYVNVEITAFTKKYCSILHGYFVLLLQQTRVLVSGTRRTRLTWMILKWVVTVS